ncbi:MAG: hypothetical protein DDT37_01260 [Firmicutes bacterium]|nr:hypothetical protein [candidate division NPL-UPA2 bacterium]
MSRFCIGLDLGQAQDYTAIAVVERVQEGGVWHCHLRHIERFPLGTSYPAIVERVTAMTKAEPFARNVVLVVDKTGVGAPVVDMFEGVGVRLEAVTITGGDTVTREADGYRVPKRDLVSVLQVLLQSERLKIAAGLSLTKMLQAELLNFKVKINIQTAHDSYGAWREGEHDDIVIAAALACWWVEHQARPVPEAVARLFHNASFFSTGRF